MGRHRGQGPQPHWLLALRSVAPLGEWGRGDLGALMAAPWGAGGDSVVVCVASGQAYVMETG